MKYILSVVHSINRDALERVAGIPEDKIVEAHGTVHTSHCIKPDCSKEYDRKWMTGNLFTIQVEYTIQ
jgi:NAD-dependent deacetylase sirtuin 2